MKNLKLAFHLRKTLLSVMRPIFAFLSHLYRRLRRHPGQTIVIFLGLVTVLIAWLTYQHIVRESKEVKKTIVTLQARIDFNKIYFSNFDDRQVLLPMSFNETWPETIEPDQLKVTFFGLKPLLWLRILNESRHPITISHVKGKLSFANYKREHRPWFEYFEQGFAERGRFPLFLESQKEEIVILPFSWPLDGLLMPDLPKLTPDSLYTAPYLVNACLLKNGKAIFGTLGAYELFMRDIFIQNFPEQIGSDSSASGYIQLRTILSSGEQFVTNIDLP